MIIYIVLLFYHPVILLSRYSIILLFYCPVILLSRCHRRGTIDFERA